MEYDVFCLGKYQDLKVLERGGESILYLTPRRNKVLKVMSYDEDYEVPKERSSGFLKESIGIPEGIPSEHILEDCEAPEEKRTMQRTKKSAREIRRSCEIAFDLSYRIPQYVPKVYDFFPSTDAEESPCYVLVMKYYGPGVTYKDFLELKIQKKPTKEGEACLENWKGKIARIQRLFPKEYLIEHAEKLGRSLMEAVEAIHRCGYIHGDINWKNILIFPNYSIRLIDFGFSKPLDPESKRRELNGIHFYLNGFYPVS